MWTNYAHSIPACIVRCFSRAASTNLMQTEKLYITVRITEKCCRGICLPIPVFGIRSVACSPSWTWCIRIWIRRCRRGLPIPIRRAASCRNGQVRDIVAAWSAITRLLLWRMLTWKGFADMISRRFGRLSCMGLTVYIRRWNRPDVWDMNITINWAMCLITWKSTKVPLVRWNMLMTTGPSIN